MEEHYLSPVISITMTDQVELKLREYFKQRNLKVGDSLPKEIELVEAMGVSRSVVREALSRLRMLGMINSRKRRGMVLAEPDVLSGFERLLEPHFLAQDTMKQLFEIRLMLEMGLGEFLFQRITQKNFQKLDEFLKVELGAKSKTELVQLDVQFHSELFKIAHNRTLARFQKMLLPLFHYMRDYNIHLEKPVQPSPVTHADLVGILKNGDAERYRIAIKKHFEPHFQLINSWTEDNKAVSVKI